MNAFLRKYQITRTDYYVVAACFAFIALCGTLLYLDLTRRVQASGEQIGTITFKRNTAQRKYTEQVIWEALDNEAPLYNFDSIRTGDLSEAVIVLNDGTKIDVAENSMIVLNLSEDATDIDFAYGSIQAKREAGEGEEVAALNIRSEDKTISIDDQEGDVSLNKGEAEDLDVVVNKGEATVASSSGQSQRIGEDERATVGDSIEVQKILLRPTAPANNQKVFVQTGTVGVRFAWEPVAGNNAVTLQVAGDRGFGSIAATRTVQTNNTTVNLSEGIYYWRLSSRNPQNGQNEFSTVLRLSVIRNTPLSLQLPADNQTVQYVNDPPLINFRWTDNDLASGYTLEVSGSPTFSDVIQQRTVQTTGTALTLPTGNYFWRVRTQSNFENAITSSEVRRLSVTQKERVSPPRPLNPVDKNIPAAYFEKSGVTFSWDRPNEIVSTEIQIARDDDFGSIVFQNSVSGNRVAVRQNLPRGDYYWRVRGTDSSGVQTDYSAVIEFSVGETEPLQLLSPPDAARIDSDSAQVSGVNLQWRRPDLFGNFQVLLGNSPSLDDARERNVTSLSTTYNLNTGTYYWKVRVIDPNGEVLSESAVRSFEVTDAFVAPTPQYPLSGMTVDMTNRTDLPLRWNASGGANITYEVSVTKKGGALMFQNTTRGTSYIHRDLRNFSEGTFIWSVRACRQFQGQRQCTETVSQEFNIVLREDLAPPVITSPGEQFIIE